jgi:flagellar hook-basal body complex protein FliE
MDVSKAGLFDPSDYFQTLFPEKKTAPGFVFGYFQKRRRRGEKNRRGGKGSELLLSVGSLDDLHTLTIQTAKADLALETLVQLRNKALDAYNEIMKMPL